MFDFTDSKEIDASDVEVSNITGSLTRKQAEAVRKRINTLNESTKKKLNIQLPPSSKHSYYPADVRTIFPTQTSGFPSNSITNKIQRPSLHKKSYSEGVQLIKQTSLEEDVNVDRHCQSVNSLENIKEDKSQGDSSALNPPNLSNRRGSEEVRLHAGKSGGDHIFGFVLVKYQTSEIASDKTTTKLVILFGENSRKVMTRTHASIVFCKPVDIVQANQSVRKTLFTGLVYTNTGYPELD